MTLFDALLQAHHDSALRGNCSHQALVAAAVGSGDYFKAMAAGLLTLGGLHAPLFVTYDLLAAPGAQEHVERMLAKGQRVPGWGNGFVKDGPDPLWTECAMQLSVENPSLDQVMDAITEVLHDHGKRIWPNPSCYTAAVALTLGLPRYAVGELLIQGRLHAWTAEFGRMQRGAPCLT